jgi:hypothetical protein
MQPISIESIYAHLGNCEFFLSQQEEMVIANLRIPPSVQKKCPEFVGWVLQSLENPKPTLGFPVAIVWRGTAYHGWYVIRFQSSLAHYISLAGIRSNPVNKIKGRCLDSNLRGNVRTTKAILLSLLESQSSSPIPELPITPTIIVGVDEYLDTDNEKIELGECWTPEQQWDYVPQSQPDWSYEDQLAIMGNEPLPLPAIATGVNRTRKQIETIAKEIGFDLSGTTKLRKQELLDTMNS